MTRTHTVPAGTMAQALVAANVIPETTVTHGVSYFDLIPYLEEALVHAQLRARVLSSMAWALDTAAINTARSIFWDTHKESVENGHIDNFADFLNRMSEMRANENYVEDLGFELGAGRLSQLSLMLKLSQDWHDKAEGAAVAAGIKYTPKSFELLIASEKAQAVDALTLAKLDALVDATLDDDHTPEELAEYKRLIAQQQSDRMQQMHASRQLVAPAVLRIISFADYRGAGETSEFWQLPIEAQSRLVSSAINTINRVLTDLAGYRQITAIEYIGIIKEGKAAIKRLNETLRSGKFVAH